MIIDEKMLGDMISSMIESGLYTVGKNAWLSGRLKSLAEQLKFRVKWKYYIRKTPPWAKARGYLGALSDNQRAYLEWVISEVAPRADAENIPISALLRQLKGAGQTRRPGRKTIDKEAKRRATLAAIRARVLAKPAQPAQQAVSPAGALAGGG